jgi:excisionase family DNA binding protein
MNAHHTLHFHELPDVLTPEETARFLRLGRNTTYEQLRQGVIPSVRIGRKLLVPKAGLAGLLAAAGSPA